ncbi:MAG: FapA family protein, partial [Planctomycetota bacterium]
VDVYGNPIPSQPGQEARLEAGINVRENPETREFHAESDGVMEVGGDTINVRPVFVIREDVDMTTGNVEFDGAVQIGGTVRDGFYVRATGDIDISGSVEAAEVVSKDGTIRVKKGITGKDRCYVSAGLNVEAKYIENARVYAHNNIEVNSAILHSEVVAGNNVIVMRSRGAIIGGVTRAGNLVQAKRLGAANEPQTKIVVGIDIAAHAQLGEIDRRLISLQNLHTHLDEVVKSMEGPAKNIAKLSARERKQLKAFKMKLLVVHYEIEKLNQARGEFLEKLTAETKGLVKVSNEVFGHVEIRIGNLVKHITTRISAVTFWPDLTENRIGQKPYIA